MSFVSYLNKPSFFAFSKKLHVFVFYVARGFPIDTHVIGNTESETDLFYLGLIFGSPTDSNNHFLKLFPMNFTRVVIEISLSIVRSPYF